MTGELENCRKERCRTPTRRTSGAVTARTVVLKRRLCYAELLLSLRGGVECQEQSAATGTAARGLSAVSWAHTG